MNDDRENPSSRPSGKGDGGRRDPSHRQTRQSEPGLGVSGTDHADSNKTASEAEDAVATAAPRWAHVTTQGHAYRNGIFDCLSIPGFILLSTAAGFGALARDAGFSLLNAVTMMATFYALPAQVVMVDQLARGGSVLAGTFSVLITAIRMLPMVVAIMPQLQAPRRDLWRQTLAVHGVAVTGWIEGMRRLPAVPSHVKLSYFLGLGGGLVGVTVLGTIIGFEAAGSLPPLLSAVLLFLTPIYFLLSMLATIRGVSEALPVVFGCALGPVFFLVAPGLDLLLTAVIGGGAAYAIARFRRSAAGQGGGT
ncbi:MAG: AzlC family ABC transporter permease [Pseudomonadota bacterium]